MLAKWAFISVQNKHFLYHNNLFLLYRISEVKHNFIGGEKVSYKRLEVLLKSKNITAYRVSKDTGIGQSTFSDWKKGRSKPKLEKLVKIAAYLNVPVEYFVKEGVNENEDCEAND